MVGDAILEEKENSAAVDMIIDPNDNTHTKRFHSTTRAEPLLERIFSRGELVYSLPALEQIRERVQRQLGGLDESHKRFENPHIYPVGLSPSLNRMRDEMINRERERLTSGE